MFGGLITKMDPDLDCATRLWGVIQQRRTRDSRCKLLFL